MATQDFALTQVSYTITSGGSSWAGANGGNMVSTVTFVGVTNIHTVTLIVVPSVDYSVIPDIAITARDWVVGWSSLDASTPSAAGRISYGKAIGLNNTATTALSDSGTLTSPWYDPLPNLVLQCQSTVAGGTNGGTITISSIVLRVTYVVVTSIVPNTGGTYGADPVTIHGAGFAVGTTVTFDGVAATSIVIVSPSLLTCLTPAHAVGAVDVVVTNPSTDTNTLVAGFEYFEVVSAASVYGGPTQFILGPPVATIVTAAVITRGLNNGTITYQWSQEDGPSYAPTIVSDTSLVTNITFPAYEPGTYTFRLTVLTEGPIGISSYGLVSFILEPTIAPRVTDTNQQCTYPTGVTLAPVVTDDGWGGSLSYAWTQLSGPGASTITSATAASTAVTFPNTAGTYLFRLAVSRSGDALIGYGTCRVAVFTGAQLTETLHTGSVTITSNGASVDAGVRNGSVRISKGLNAVPSCSFIMDANPVSYGNEVIVSRGGTRLFGGICMSAGVSFFEKIANPFYPINLVGFAWHLGRVTVSKTYTGWTISAIVADLLTLAPGSISGTYIASGLPVITITFTDTFIDEALDQLAKMIKFCHWFVDDLKAMHFTALEASGDPIAITSAHPWYKNFALVRDLSQTINRVKIHYVVQSLVPVAVDSEVEVDSLEGYNPSGGYTTINGTRVHYTGTRSAYVDPVFGTVLVQWSQTMQTTADGEFTAAVELIGYQTTFSTNEGETTEVAGSGAIYLTGGNNAWKLKLTSVLGPAANIARVKYVNFYRNSNEGGGYTNYVGRIPMPEGGSFIDEILAANIDTFARTPPGVNTADRLAFYLTGCTGSVNSEVENVITINDTTAQSTLAALIGGGDSGVIEARLNAGAISDADATTAARALVDAWKAVRVSASYSVHDEAATPGQTTSINLGSPVNFADDLKIQQVDIQGFTIGTPHEYRVQAARNRISLEDVLKRNLNPPLGS